MMSLGSASYAAHSFNNSVRYFSLGVVLLLLAACGGGSGDGAILGGSSSASNSSLSSTSSPTYTAGSYSSASTYAAHCAAPRTGTDPTTGKAYVDVAGSITWENFWLRSWTHQYYLWYSEVPDLNPANYSTTDAYFQLIKTSATTASGKLKDPVNFHFTYNTAQWVALSQSGVSADYGATWSLIRSTPPRQAVVAYTQPNSPATAASANLSRGEQVISVDGVDLINDNTSAGIATLNAGLFPSNVGEKHSFVIQALNGAQRTVTMTSASITETPVLNYASPGVLPTSSGNVGYIVFNDHIATAESELIQAFTSLKNTGVTDLVLDIRYNGGGYLDIASEVAYMVAGSARTSGKNFESLVFNSQYVSTVNPVTGGANTPTPFYTSALGFSATSGTALPSLNLSRVFVITGTGTCSASEAIINGLQGVGVQVIQIGSTTCGKPYGFYPQDNCGTTYFSIEFKGVNNLGFGDYADGFTPNNSSNTSTARLPGCSIADDFTHALGNTSEGRLAAALFYRASPTQSCPSGPTGNSTQAQIQSVVDGVDLSDVDGDIYKGPWRENRIMTR
jgi:carboxyl-terminal processing protease